VTGVILSVTAVTLCTLHRFNENSRRFSVTGVILSVEASKYGEPVSVSLSCCLCQPLCSRY
jgi:hypothetical protein